MQLWRPREKLSCASTCKHYISEQNPLKNWVKRFSVPKSMDQKGGRGKWFTNNHISKKKEALVAENASEIDRTKVGFLYGLLPFLIDPEMEGVEQFFQN